MHDGVDIRNGELIAVQVDTDVEETIDISQICKYFGVKENHYEVVKTIKNLHSVKDLREILYRDGFYCDGIHYVRFKRSSGSSRVGKCLFIDEALYPRMHKWEMCGIKVKHSDNIDLAALEAYISLTTSSIIDTINIDPRHILVIDDYESSFQDDVVATWINDEGWLESSKKNVQISNSIWDGQTLLDKSCFGQYEDKGMLLLRNRFFKSCCFNTNIQKFFSDHNRIKN